MKALMKKLPLFFMICLMCCTALLVPFGGGEASAATDTAEEAPPTSALQDLLRDNNFDPATYPSNEKDYSIQIIQIAESLNNGLVIYTYQPSQKTIDLTATEINMALSKSVDGTRLYQLTLLNSEEVFCKYKVNDFSISNDPIRYYNITSIYRKWEDNIDEPTGNDNTKSAVAFPVGKLYIVTTKDDHPVYTCENRDVIEILNPYTGFIRYMEGIAWHKQACDSHYVAFSTDMKIDELYAAELEYKSYTYEQYTWTDTGTVAVEVGDTENHHIVLTDDEEFKKDGNWWLLSEDIEYSRIQKIDVFIANENLTDIVKENLQTQEWVLRFCETDYTYQYYGFPLSNPGYDETGTRIKDVTILRLYFKSDGITYNLGAVSDKVNESSMPSNNERDPLTVVPWYIWLILVLLIIAAIIVLLIFFPVLRPIFLAIGKMLVWLVLAPFRLIAWLIKKISAAVKRRQEAKAAAPPKVKEPKDPVAKASKETVAEKSTVTGQQEQHIVLEVRRQASKASKTKTKAPGKAPKKAQKKKTSSKKVKKHARK